MTSTNVDLQHGQSVVNQLLSSLFQSFNSIKVYSDRQPLPIRDRDERL